MFEPTIAAFIDYWEGARRRTEKALPLIPPERVDWVPAPGAFTFGDLIRHLGAAERWLFVGPIVEGHSTYQGCGPELGATLPKAIDYMRRMHAESVALLCALPDEALLRRVKTPAGLELRVWKWLRAMTEHEAHHRGQLYLYLRCLGIRPPELFGLTSEEVIARSSTGEAGAS